MKDNKPNSNKNTTDEPLFGNDHLPKVEITVTQKVMDHRKQSKEYILADESLFYVSAIFHLLMMVSPSEVHRDTDQTLAIRTLGFLGKTFADIAWENLEHLEVETDA